MIPVFFTPRKVVDYMTNNYVGDDIEKKCLSLIKAYALWGCDYLPGFFSINHGLGMMSFDELWRNQAISPTKDFLELILKTYQNKNQLLKRLYTESPDINVDTRMMQTREVLKSARGVENLTIPLPSVLKLQIFRAEYVSKMWTSFSFTERPENFG